MKFESINSNKFSRFERNEILDTINIIGGKAYRTRKPSESTWTDCWDDSTGDDITTTTTSYDNCVFASVNLGGFNEV